MTQAPSYHGVMQYLVFEPFGSQHARIAEAEESRQNAACVVRRCECKHEVVLEACRCGLWISKTLVCLHRRGFSDVWLVCAVCTRLRYAFGSIRPFAGRPPPPRQPHQRGRAETRPSSRGSARLYVEIHPNTLPLSIVRKKKTQGQRGRTRCRDSGHRPWLEMPISIDFRQEFAADRISDFPAFELSSPSWSGYSNSTSIKAGGGTISPFY